MAVTTRAKRLSMMNFSSEGQLLPDPSGTVDGPARATLLDLYSGITLQGYADPHPYKKIISSDYIRKIDTPLG